MRMRDLRHALRPPLRSRPAEPAASVLIEDAQGLVAQLRELGAPARSAADRAVLENHADDVDLLAAVHLVPQRLEDLPERGAVGVAAMHQLRDVLEAHVTGEQLLVIEDTNPAAPRLGVPLEREVHFLDTVTLRARAELRFGAGRRAAEQDVVGFVHSQLPVASWRCHLSALSFGRAFSSPKLSMSVPISRPLDVSRQSCARDALSYPSAPSYPSTPSWPSCLARPSSSPGRARRSSGTSRRFHHPAPDGSTSRSPGCRPRGSRRSRRCSSRSAARTRRCRRRPPSRPCA